MATQALADGEACRQGMASLFCLMGWVPITASSPVHAETW
jgi:hypothetical protein